MAVLAALPGFALLPGQQGGLAIGGLPRSAGLSAVAAPGSRTALVTATASAAVWVVHRDARGRLRLRGCVRPPFQHTCAPQRAPGHLNASPLLLAGHDVYVADGAHGVLAHYRRTGERLRYQGCLADTRHPHCGDTEAAGLAGALQGAVVRGGRALAFSTDGGTIALFGREPSGAPAGLACVGGPSSTHCTAGVVAQTPTLSLAGSDDWLFTSGGDSISTFQPGIPGSPAPVKGTCVTDAGSFFAEVDDLPGCASDEHAAGDSDFGMTLFATPRFLYSTDFTSGGIGLGIGWWRRDGGTLTFAGCIDEGAGGEPSSSDCAGGRAAATDPQLFAVTRSGRLMIAGETTAQGLALLRVDPASGALRPLTGRRSCITPGGGAGNPFNPSTARPRRECLADRRVAQTAGMAPAPNGRLLFVTEGHRLAAYAIRP